MKTTCPDCQTATVKGFLLDFAHGAILQSHWHPGEPVKRKLLGLPAGVRSQKAQMKPVVSYRCESCGFIKLYAK